MRASRWPRSARSWASPKRASASCTPRRSSSSGPRCRTPVDPVPADRSPQSGCPHFRRIGSAERFRPIASGCSPSGQHKCVATPRSPDAVAAPIPRFPRTRPRLAAALAGAAPDLRRAPPGRWTGRRCRHWERRGAGRPPDHHGRSGSAKGAGVVDAGDRSGRPGVRRPGRAVRTRAPGDRHLRSGGGDRSGAGRREDRVRRSGGRDHLGQPRGRPGRPGDPGTVARPGHGGPGRLPGAPGPGRPGPSRRSRGGRRVGVGGDPTPERAGRRGLCRSSRIPDRPAEAAAGSVAGTWRPSGRLTGPGRLTGRLLGPCGRGLRGLCYRPARARMSGLQRTPVDGTRRCPLRCNRAGRGPGPPHDPTTVGAQRAEVEPERQGGPTVAVVTMRQLLEAGVHFGHQTRRWNPKMKRFIYGERNGIYIIDLQKTSAAIESTYGFLRDTVAKGGNVLFVGTKKQAQESIRTQAERVGMPYVNFRWLGGMLTNFTTIYKRLQRLKELEAMEATGATEVLPKKEVLRLGHEREKLERNLGGIRDMTRLPAAVWVVDTRKEHIAVTEARKLGIPVVAILDTNCD